MSARPDVWKAWKTLQAEVLLAGKPAELIEADAGQPVLIVTEGPCTKQITDLAEARAWAGIAARREPRMTALTIANVGIRQDASGRFSMNDLHRAAGAEKRHQPSDWLRLQQTQALVAELEREAPGIPGTDVAVGVGTFACRELVIAYAAWISPAFHLRVLRTFDEATRQPQRHVAPAELSRLDLIQLALQAEQERVALVAHVDELTPKAEALDRLTVADGAMSITNAAKVLGVPPRRLFAWLSEHQWLYRRPGSATWTAYQSRLQVGYLVCRVTTIERGDGTDKVVEHVQVTPKGLAKLSQALAIEGTAALTEGAAP
jgi:phage antirepressor YoqD-like protein